MLRKSSIAYDLVCAQCGENLPPTHESYRSLASYLKAKNGRLVFCTRGHGTKYRHANMTPEEKAKYYAKIAQSRKSRTPAEKRATRKKIRETVRKFSAEKREDIARRRVESFRENNDVSEVVAKRNATMERHLGKDWGKVRYEAIKRTMQARHGIDNPGEAGSAFRHAADRTSFERYGVDSVSKCTQAKTVKRKLVNTYIERHGGIGRASETADSRYKQTMQARYGVDNPMKDAKLAKAMGHAYSNGGFVKAMETKRRNGTTPKEVAWKGHETKKRNGSYKFNKQEYYIFQWLQKLCGPQVEYQYRDHPEYPWVADFYDPVTNTIYEFQGYFSHGAEPFDRHSENHRKQLKKLSKQENWASELTIKVWTKIDPKKRKVASNSGFKFVEWFSIKEFNEWRDRRLKREFKATRVIDGCFTLGNGHYLVHHDSPKIDRSGIKIIIYPWDNLNDIKKYVRKGMKNGFEFDSVHKLYWYNDKIDHLVSDRILKRKGFHQVIGKRLGLEYSGSDTPVYKLLMRHGYTKIVYRGDVIED